MFVSTVSEVGFLLKYQYTIPCVYLNGRIMFCTRVLLVITLKQLLVSMRFIQKLISN